MRIAAILNAKDKYWKRQEVATENLKFVFGEHDVGQKDGEGFVPVEFKPGTTRADRNVITVTGLVLDIDGIDAERLREAESVLRSLGVSFYGYASHGYTPEKIKLRYVIPFIAPLAVTSPRHWSRVTWPTLIKHLGFDRLVDTQCRNVSHFYYSPRKPSEGSPHPVWHHEGTLFDPAGIATAAAPPPGLELGQVVASIPAGPPRDEKRPVPINALRHKLARYSADPENVPLIRRLLAGEALLAPHSVRPANSPFGRRMAWLKVLGVVSMKLEGWESSQALWEGLFSPSYIKEVGEAAATGRAGDEPTDLADIRNSFEDARASAPSKKAERRARVEAQTQAIKKMIGYRDGDKGGGGSQSAGEESDENGEGDPAIATEGLIPARNKAGDIIEGSYKSCPANANYILQHWPRWRGVFKANDLRQVYELHGGPLCKEGEVRDLDDADPTKVSNWFARLPPPYTMSVSEIPMRSQLQALCLENAYDPLRDYLLGLKWDGVDRLTSFLETYFGVALEEDGEDLTEHIRRISRMFCIQAAKRALEPGCQAESVLVLEGAQYEGKTSALRILGGQFYSEVKIDVHSKDTLSLIGKNWIFELAELRPTKVDRNAFKAFTSRTQDEFRAAYGHYDKVRKRRCVLIGTSNDLQFDDPTGNRRYWPVFCSKIDLESLRQDRDQIWAQAVVCAQAHERYWLLKGPELEMAERCTARRMAPNLLAEAILEWVLRTPVESRPAFVTALQVCKEVDAINLAKGNTAGAISEAMRRLRWAYKRMPTGDRLRGYEVPQDIREAPAAKSFASQVVARRPRPDYLEKIEGGKPDGKLPA